MDSFEAIFHIERVKSGYFEEKIRDGTIEINNQYGKNGDTWKYMYHDHKINIVTSTRIAVHDIILPSKVEDFKKKLMKLAKITFVSFIGTKTIDESAHNKIKKYMFTNLHNPTCYGNMWVCYDNILHDYSSTEENASDSSENSVSTQCQSHTYGFILRQTTLCINGENAHYINRLYCDIIDVDYDNYMIGMIIKNVNLYNFKPSGKLLLKI